MNPAEVWLIIATLLGGLGAVGVLIKSLGAANRQRSETQAILETKLANLQSEVEQAHRESHEEHELTLGQIGDLREKVSEVDRKLSVLTERVEGMKSTRRLGSTLAEGGP